MSTKRGSVFEYKFMIKLQDYQPFKWSLESNHSFLCPSGLIWFLTAAVWRAAQNRTEWHIACKITSKPTPLEMLTSDSNSWHPMNCKNHALFGVRGKNNSLVSKRLWIYVFYSIARIIPKPGFCREIVQYLNQSPLLPKIVKVYNWISWGHNKKQ